MKSSYSIILAFLLISLSINATEPVVEAADDKTGIDFHSGTWEEALELAKKEGKPIFLDISASWCGPCKLLKKNTFPNADVGDFYNKNFINVLIDGEKGEGPDLAKKFKISGYPSMIFLKSNGEVIGMTAGYKAPEEFIELGKHVLSL